MKAPSDHLFGLGLRFKRFPHRSISNAMKFEDIKNRFQALDIDVEQALSTLQSSPISLHCWQGDDVTGFEEGAGNLDGGLAVTGNYPGRARTIDELRQDIDVALSLIPGKHRVNLHAIYGDFGNTSVDRDAIELGHFESWIEWAKERKLGIDFNPSCFSHHLASDGLTLSHPEKRVRDFWIEHCIRCRGIAAEIGKRLNDKVVNNLWVPDGMKDQPVDRMGLRTRLAESLDTIFEKPYPLAQLVDSVESKLFGIGSESMVVGSHEFYLGYAIRNQKALCLDAGHFHPTESIADKISSVLMYVPQLLLHVSRGVRWDSDHVVIIDDQTTEIMRELVRCQALDRTHIGLDFFDASINRIAAWVAGTRAAQKCLLIALLEPIEKLRAAERSANYTERLLILEQVKSLPWGLVWEEFCIRNDTPTEAALCAEIKAYEASTLSLRK